MGISHFSCSPSNIYYYSCTVNNYHKNYNNFTLNYTKLLQLTDKIGIAETLHKK